MISFADIGRHVWACAPNYVELFIQDLAALDSSRLSVPSEDGRAPPSYDLRDGVAHIPLTGMIMRNVPPALHDAGIPATSTTETAVAIRAALADDEVGSIMLDIDSPGGTLAGTAELADLVYAARAAKPIAAHAQDLAASAAYWVGSQADRFSASQSAQLGSIGVYRVMVDTSAAAANAGAVVHVIRSGDLKGAGSPGAPITGEALAVEQEIIDRAGDLFATAVQRGRGTLEISSVTTGRTWLAGDAAGHGLIDGIETAAQAHAAAREAEPVAPDATTAEPLPIASVDEKYNPRGSADARIERAIAAAGFSPGASRVGALRIARMYSPADPGNISPRGGRLTVFWPRLVQAAHAIRSPLTSLTPLERVEAREKIAAYFAAYGAAAPSFDQETIGEPETEKPNIGASRSDETAAAGGENKKEEIKTMSDHEPITGPELENLKAELLEAKQRAEKAEAHASAAVTSLTDVRASQKATAIDKAATEGRVTPAMRTSIEAYAEKCGDDVDALGAFLASLPAQTSPETIGAEQEQIEQTEDEGLGVVASLFNRNTAEVEALANVRAVTSDGFAIKHDGSRERLSNLIKGA